MKLFRHHRRRSWQNIDVVDEPAGGAFNAPPSGLVHPRVTRQPLNSRQPTAEVSPRQMGLADRGDEYALLAAFFQGRLAQLDLGRRHCSTATSSLSVRSLSAEIAQVGD